jgi:hypothetical protein
MIIFMLSTFLFGLEIGLCSAYRSISLVTSSLPVIIPVHLHDAHPLAPRRPSCSYTKLSLCAGSEEVGSRKSAGHGSRFDGFTQEVFQLVNRMTMIQEVSADPTYSQVHGNIRNETVDFTCQLYSIDQARYLRLVRFYGCDYDVFNFIIIPTHPRHQPVLGLDLVVVKDKAIIAIDFQPTHNSSSLQASVFYHELMKLHQIWSSKFSQQSLTIPSNYADYFSKYCLFLRADARDEELWPRIRQATLAYLQLYLECLAMDTDTTTAATNDGDVYDEYLKKYLDFRIVNDPAKNILNAAFGKDWTTRALQEAVFPYRSKS